MIEVYGNVFQAHTCFKQMFLGTPAALASYIKYDFSACVEKTVGCVCARTGEGKEQSNPWDNQYFSFICIVKTAKKVGVYTGDTDLGIDLVYSL